MKVFLTVAGLLAAYLLLPLLQQEAWGWCPILAKRLVRLAAGFVPLDQRERYREEWLAEVEAYEGRNLSMVMMAARILLFAPHTGLANLRLRTPNGSPAPTGMGPQGVWAPLRNSTVRTRRGSRRSSSTTTGRRFSVTPSSVSPPRPARSTTSWSSTPARPTAAPTGPAPGSATTPSWPSGAVRPGGDVGPARPPHRRDGLAVAAPRRLRPRAGGPGAAAGRGRVPGPRRRAQARALGRAAGALEVGFS